MTAEGTLALAASLGQAPGQFFDLRLPGTCFGWSPSPALIVVCTRLWGLVKGRINEERMHPMPGPRQIHFFTRRLF